MKVKTEREFDAAHKLIEDEGACGNLHGHRWKVTVWAEGDMRTDDMLFDFRDLKDITEMFDHKYLNEVISFNPTAENIALYILDILTNKYDDLSFTVRVHESPKSYAEVES